RRPHCPAFLLRVDGLRTQPTQENILSDLATDGIVDDSSKAAQRVTECAGGFGGHDRHHARRGISGFPSMGPATLQGFAQKRLKRRGNPQAHWRGDWVLAGTRSAFKGSPMRTLPRAFTGPAYWAHLPGLGHLPVHRSQVSPRHVTAAKSPCANQLPSIAWRLPSSHPQAFRGRG